MRQYYRGSNVAPILLQILICITTVILIQTLGKSNDVLGNFLVFIPKFLLSHHRPGYTLPHSPQTEEEYQ